MLTPVGPVLLGFAAAEHAIAAMNHTPAAALKPGFAAVEQYGGVAETRRGPWTDLYALAAVIYAAITGSDPAPAADRLAEDRLAPLSTIAAGLYSERFLSAIDAALVVQPERRPRDHLQFRALMGDIETPERLELAPPLDLMQEPFTGGVAGHREITVPDGPLPAASLPAAAAPGGLKAKAAPGGTVPEGAAPRAERALPSWMRAGQRSGAFGKRAAYGLVAATCALIGIATLALQFYARQGSHAPRPALAQPAAATSLSTPVANASPAPAASVVAAPKAATPIGGAVTEPAPAPRETAATPATRLAPAGSPPPVTLAAPATPAERQALCLEILQKASLEPISQAETAFFKKECK
jgi:hypothetical protein